LKKLKLVYLIYLAFKKPLFSETGFKHLQLGNVLRRKTGLENQFSTKTRFETDLKYLKKLFEKT